ncbi:DUF58 domain-containing protein [Bacillus taeanensis]|uniref:DUF58 domain-containing protein n=1 Tax=Bacillus taeanensis TaxID=273032 RepID=A0A366XRD5_9BACI|nr:DUF58 domain-containing protein [Bacillus taeanensis]RBW67685.1 DUF58 domain-containing protein [Bacillus taeanensis]
MSELLSPAILKQLSRFSFAAPPFIRGTNKGEHRSTKHGSSLEFSDFRLYYPGDDLRQIDWNTYARTHKHYIKRFLDEKELTVSVYVDATRSMGAHEEKWQRTKQLAAVFSFITLMNNDRLSLKVLSNSNQTFHPIIKGKAAVHNIFNMIAKFETLAHEESFASVLQHTVKNSKGHEGISVMISDFLEAPEPIFEGIKLLQARKQKILLMQVLLPEEKSPAYAGDLKLIDIENGASRDVSMNRAVLESYDQRFREHEKTIRAFAGKRGIGFVSSLTNEPLEEVVFSRIAANGFMMAR